MARTTKIVTFSIPPAMEEQLRQVAEEDGRTVSELLREGFRLYLEDREWRRRERTQVRHSRQDQQEETRRNR
ncbi:MAG: ribbon-helix-helix protein, CopG family [Dehalococcoidia bacterium]|nr:ribbon-helix-helix protein, CopG family [Dehalococcoidia bacterium]